MRKRSLGRGLSQLLSGDTPALSRTVVEVALDDLEPNPRQPRRGAGEPSLEELAVSIEAHGVLQPVIVRRRGDGYELVAGERRWRAARMAGLETIPCLVQDLDDPTALQIALIENVQREDLNEIELAEGYQCLVEDFGLTQEELAQRIGKSRSAVTNTLRLLELPAEVQDLVRMGKLSAGHGRALLGLGREDYICELAKYVVDKGLSVRDTEAAVGDFLELASGAEQVEPVEAAKETSTKPARDPYLVEAEERVQLALAVKVLIKPLAKRGGVIEIHYYDDEDLSRIVDEIEGATGRFP